MDKILVTRSSMPNLDEYVNEIAPIWDSRWMTNMGPKHHEFRQQLIKYLGVSDLELFTNGHMALELALQALNLKGEVITTPFTFASTTHAAVRNGLTPVFCDIDPLTYTMDAGKLETLVTERTCAILPVHVYGNICDVEEIARIARRHDLKVVYDAAHAFGETYYEKGAGSFGDVSIFSFHATKVFNSIEGGAACFADKRLGDSLSDLKNFGIHGPEEVCAVGANAKMNEFCAAMGICNLRHVEEEIAKRKKAAERYRQRLSDIKGIRLNVIQKGVRSNYSYFPILIDEKIFGADRSEVSATLAENGILARKYFYPLTSAFSAFHGKYDPSETPEALRISRQVLTLPMYAGLSLEETDRICDVILSCRKRLLIFTGRDGT